MANEMQVTTHLTCGQNGIRYTHYLNTQDYDASLIEGIKLAKAYLGCCGYNVRCPLIVASQLDIPGDSVIATDVAFTNLPPNTLILPGKGSGIQPALQDTADLWWTAVELRLGCTASVYGRQFMRLIPDTAVEGPDFDDLKAGLRVAIDKYFDALALGGWGMMALPRGPAQRKDIASIVVDPVTKDATIVTRANHGVVAGKKFHIGQFGPQLASISPNGTWYADLVPNPTTIVVQGYQSLTLPSTWRQFGKLWSLQLSFTGYARTLMKVVRVVTRKAGAAIFTLKGRNKRKPAPRAIN